MIRSAEDEDETMTEPSKNRTIAYWVLTALVLAGETNASFRMLTHNAGAVEGLAALGYPAYFLTILGSFKLAGVVTLALPNLPRLKEWAYAGFAFDFVGAAASHALNGDPFGKIALPLIVLASLAGSYLLRPADRRLV